MRLHSSILQRNNKEKDILKKVRYTTTTPRSCDIQQTKSNSTIKQTDENTKTIESTEHWLTQWLNEYVLVTYNTVQSTIPKS